MEKKAAAAPSYSSSPASSLRWEILRRAFLSRSSSPSGTFDLPSQLGIKRISRKTAGCFNLIPCHLLNGNLIEDLDALFRIKDLGGLRDAHVCYNLPVAKASKLILIQRMENCIDLDDFEFSNSYDVDNTGLICCWPSEDVLAHFCLNHLDMFRSKRVLELGSGYGLAGLAIAAGTDACEVVISDGNPQVVDSKH